MPKINTEKLLWGLVILCSLFIVGVGGQLLLNKASKDKPFDGNNLVDALKTEVKYPDRIVISPDPTAQGRVQLSYTYLSEEDGAKVAGEIVEFARKFTETIKNQEAPVSMITIVSFNPATKKPLRLLLGSTVSSESPILSGSTSEVIEALRVRCKKTRADVLSNFCNVSDALVTASKGNN